MKVASAKKARTKTPAKSGRRAAPVPPSPPEPAPCAPEAEPLPPPAQPAPQLVRLVVEGVPAAAVRVAGCFNDWSATATPMTALAPGCWSVELALLPGRYEYLLLVDGQWQTDPRCTQWAPNPYGGVNCVLEVFAAA